MLLISRSGLNRLIRLVQSTVADALSGMYPWTLASYACWRVGQVITMMGAEGKKVGNLYFAGQHTSLCFQGYMEGAVETGEAVAKQIALSL